MSVLHALADVAAIVTAVVAGCAYGKYRFDRYRRHKRLREHLAFHSPKYMDELIQELWMTETEIFEAARGLGNVETRMHPGAAGIPARLEFRHIGAPRFDH